MYVHTYTQEHMHLAQGHAIRMNFAQIFKRLIAFIHHWNTINNACAGVTIAKSIHTQTPITGSSTKFPKYTHTCVCACCVLSKAAAACLPASNTTTVHFEL